MIPKSLLVCLGLSVFYICQLCAHFSEEAGIDPAVRCIGPSDKPVPWTHIDFKNDPDNFQFAIVADRTGSEREGIFAEAMRKLNLLQPEFVLCVGDLIEGYTEDRAELEAEWDELDAYVRSLEMPFFYVAGNHDYTNPVMAEVWKSRYGNSYYHFIYRDVLFVILNSNDGGRTHSMSEEQLGWFERVLAEHPDVRWTLVFLHNPFWDREGQGLWPRFEAALGERDFTVFAGHYHSYLKSHRGGHNFYMLATTGGGSNLSGPRMGSFDHIGWVTMSDDGPILANLMLDGIWDDAVRTEELRAFQRATWWDGHMVLPIVIEEDPSAPAAAVLDLRNDSVHPYTFALSARSFGGMRLHGSTQRLITVNPGEKQQVELVFEKEPGAVQAGLIGELDWRVETVLEEGPVFYEGTAPIAAVHERGVPEKGISLDGDLAEWGDLRYVVDKAGAIRSAPENWEGPEDLSFSFDVAQDAEAVYLAVRARDDKFTTDVDRRLYEQDSIFLSLDARPFAQRARNRKSWGDPGIFRRHMVPDPAGARISDPDTLPEGFAWKLVRTADGYQTEMRFTRELLAEIGGAPVDGFRLNVGVTDLDSPGEDRLVLLWFPEWRDAESLPGQGLFRLSR